MMDEQFAPTTSPAGRGSSTFAPGLADHRRETLLVGPQFLVTDRRKLA
ncbi:hypothetical protein [Kibdelosporangium philippinense]